MYGHREAGFKGHTGGREGVAGTEDVGDVLVGNVCAAVCKRMATELVVVVVVVREDRCRVGERLTGKMCVFVIGEVAVLDWTVTDRTGPVGDCGTEGARDVDCCEAVNDRCG